MGLGKNLFDIGKTAHPFGKAAGAAPYLQTDAIAEKICSIPFEDSLSEEQIDVFHKILDCVSDTVAAEMRAAYKVGFKDGVAFIREIQE